MSQPPVGEPPVGQSSLSPAEAMQFGAAGPDAAAGGQPVLPETPPAPPMLRPVPLPPSYQPLKTAAQVPPVALTAPVVPMGTRAAPVRTPDASAMIARAQATPVAVGRTDATWTEASIDGTRPDVAPMVTARTDTPPEAARLERAHADVARVDPASTKAAMPDGSVAATVLPAAHMAPDMASDAGPRTATPTPTAAATATTPTATTPTAAATRDGDATFPRAALATGDDSTPMVQFAATASEVSARLFWQALVHRFPDALAQREPVVVRYVRDGEVFWRVRTEGFVNLAEAQTLCAQMRADGQPCFVPRS